MPLTPGQLSLFGVEAAEPDPGDLAGLLAGPGQVERMGGTARVSVLVDGAWRVHVLVAELAARGLSATWSAVEPAMPAAGRDLGRDAGRDVPEERPSRLAVRTAYTVALAPLAAAWLRGGLEQGKSAPVGFHLNGPRLRLWVAAAGSQDPPGFLLGLGRPDEAVWDPVGAALAAAGLPGVLVGTGPSSPSGPGYRIVGRRRLARLAELVGDRPRAAPAELWPG